LRWRVWQATPKAVTAAADKPARLIYTMRTKGQEYTAREEDYFEERYGQRSLHNLAQRARAMGMQLSTPPSFTETQGVAVHF
jgi:hypothetical protein